MSGRRRRLRAQVVAVAACVVVAVATPGAMASRPGDPRPPVRDPGLEYRIKAAYLLNFTRYVEWPASALPGPGAPLVLCVYGADPFGAVLDAAVAGRTSQGRTIQVRRTDVAAVARGCHVVFVSYGQWRRQPDILTAISHAGVLTVGESAEFAEAGGVIGFTTAGGSVRFAVNLVARDAAQLRISSRMLSLAARLVTRQAGAAR